MQVRDIMTPNPDILPVDATIREAARFMKENDYGLVPVYDGDRLIGMVTDRDIAVRAVAAGLPAEDKLSKIMTRKVLYCLETDDVESVLLNMQEEDVQRLVVLDNVDNKSLVGVISTADIAEQIHRSRPPKSMIDIAHY